MEKISTYINDHFILITCTLSGILGVLYFWQAIQIGFSLPSYIIITFKLLYIPFALIFKKKAFCPFYFLYSAVLVFIIAFEKTYLYNNFTALFIVCIVIMCNPKFTVPVLISYFVTICIAFSINEEEIYHFLIHITRSLWFISLMIYVTNHKFKRHELLLYDDEKLILDQLCNGKIYQKEVEGFSENTVYRKLKAARERNGNISREELINKYKIMKELEQEQKD